LLYTAVPARWVVEGAERSEEGRFRRAAVALVLATNLAMVALPPAIALLVLMGVVS
jgi:hypothetical protein